MSEMIERMAQAMLESDAVKYQANPADYHWTAYENTARAAIKAMQEPTEAMLKAAEYSYVKPGAPSTWIIWRAMVDAALNE